MWKIVEFIKNMRSRGYIVKVGKKGVFGAKSGKRGNCKAKFVSGFSRVWS